MRRQERAYAKTPLLAAFALLLLSAHAGAAPWVKQALAPQYFAVSVADVDRSVDWYCKALGLRKLDDKQADDGRWRIANLANDDLFVEVIWDKRDQAVDRARGFAKVGFRVPDVDQVADRVKINLGERPRVLDFKQHRIRLLQLRDPDGNIVQLSSPLVDQKTAPSE